MVSTAPKPTTHGTAANMWWTGLKDEPVMRKKRQEGTGVVLFAIRSPGGGRSKVFDAYTLKAGRVTTYDHTNGIQILGPDQLKNVIANFYGDASYTDKTQCQFFLDKVSGLILIRHSLSPESIENTRMLTQIQPGQIKEAITACPAFGVVASTGKLSGFNTLAQRAVTGYQCAYPMGKVDPAQACEGEGLSAGNAGRLISAP